MRPGSLHPSAYTWQRLAEALLAHDEITPAQRKDIETLAPATAQKLQKKREGALNGRTRRAAWVTPPEVISELHLTATDGRPLNEDRVMQTVAKLAGLPYKKIDPLKLDHKLITKTMTRAFARRQVCLPLTRDDSGLTFAVDNPFDQDLLHQLTMLAGGDVNFVVSSKTDIDRIVTEIYGFQHSIKAAESDLASSYDLGNLEQLVKLKRVDELEVNDQHIVNAVEYLLHYAYEQRASDIHMEPSRGEARVRLRIDGVLHELFRVPIVVHKAMISRMKTMARMDIAEKRRPQDGRIKTQAGESETELRVSSMPVAFGEKVVVRIFDPMKLLCQLPELGFDGEQESAYSGFLGRRHGMILVTGPTGSGKTTTLYSTLRHLAAPDVNIVTIEDPIEMVVEEFNQVLVQRKIDLDFANAMRSILRQDPDIIMLGEIRDAETARMAVQAAQTGHLVLSTVHTNDSASAITRLRDLGVPSFMISSSLIGVIAQRLVRLVCDNCAFKTELSVDEAAALDIKIPEGASTQLPVRRGQGCPRCRETGLYGRIGVYEVLPVTNTIRNLIREDADAKVIYKAARTDGMVSLRESAIRQLAEGRTQFDEVIRVLGQE